MPRTLYAEVMAAPVCPAETIASAFPSPMRFAQTRMDEFLFRRRGARELSVMSTTSRASAMSRSEEHTSELQSLAYLVCRLLLEKKKKKRKYKINNTRQ